MMRFIICSIVLFSFSLVSFAQSRKDIEDLCKAAVVAAQKNDFLTAKQNYDLAISLISNKPNSDLLLSVPDCLSEYVILTLSKINNLDAFNSAMDLLILQKHYIDFSHYQECFDSCFQLIPARTILHNFGFVADNLKSKMGNYSIALEVFINTIEKISNSNNPDLIWCLQDDLLHCIIERMAKSNIEDVNNLINQIWDLRKASLNGIYNNEVIQGTSEYYSALALSLFNIGQILTLVGLFDYAEPYYNQVIEIIDNEGLTSKECATILLLIGIDYRNLKGASNIYLKCYFMALEIISQIKGDINVFISESIFSHLLNYYYNEVGYLAYHTSDNSDLSWGNSIKSYEICRDLICTFSKMIEDLKTRNNQEDLEVILNQFLKKDNYGEAILNEHYLLSSLSLFHNNISQCIYHLKNMTHYTEDLNLLTFMAISMASKLQDYGLYRQAINLLEDVKHRLGYNNRFDLIERLNLECATLSLQFGDYDKCWDYCGEIVNVKEISKDTFFYNPLCYSSILTIIGQLYMLTDDMKMCIYCYSMAESIINRNIHLYPKNELANFYQNYSLVCLDTHNLSGAYSNIEKAIKLANQYCIDNGGNADNPLDPLYPAIEYHTLANILIIDAKYKEAKNVLENCLCYFMAYNNEYRGLCHIYISLGYIYKQLSNSESDIITYFTKGYQIALSRFLKDSFTLIADERSSLWYDSLLPDMLGKYSCLAKEDNMADLCFNVALTNKGFLLNYSKIIEKNVYNSHDMNLISSYELFKHAERQKDVNVRELQVKMMHLYSLHDEFHSEIEYTAWQDVQRQLKKNDLAIEFTVCDKDDSNSYAALLLKKDWDTPKIIELCEESELKRIMADGANLYKDNDAAYSCIWEKLEPYFKKGDNIYFAPYGLIHQLNIEVLCVADGKPMNKKCNLYRLSSTGNLVDKREDLKYTSATLFGGLNYDTDTTSMVAINRKYVTSPSYQRGGMFIESVQTRAGWSYLPGTAEEVRNVGNILDRNKIETTTYTDEVGTEESFKALSGNSTPIIHIATHGFYLEDKNARKEGLYEFEYSDIVQTISPLKRSGLIFSGGQHAWLGREIPEGIDDGVLTAEEIAGMNLTGTDLLVLSACQTGLGEITNEGVEGLQRGFKIAGVNTIIMSLWEVSDAATEVLMTKFYSLLIKGKTKREAFDAAVEAVKKEYPSPEYWAAFIMLD